MARKIAGYAVLLICLAAYVVSSVDDWTIGLYNYKFSKGSWLSSDKYKYGDLYGMSYLSKFRIQPDVKSPNVVTNTNPRKINLYSVCDSYFWSFIDSAKYFYGVDTVITAKTNSKEVLTNKLDTGKINVLLLEFSERNVIDVLTDTAYVKKIIPDNNSTSIKAAFTEKTSTVNSLNNLKKEAIATIFNKKINSNIESNIWDYSIFSPVKQIRANINYKLFGIVNKDVSIDNNGKQLYFNLTIDTSANTSSFKHLPQAKLDTVINNLNYLYEAARKNKFDKIYLSIIPNSISILNPNYQHLTYNRLVQKIQSSPKLKMHCINILPDFEKNKTTVFSRSDTHWSINGLNIWLQKLNVELKRINEDN